MIYIRIGCFVIVTVTALFSSLWIFVPSALLYALVFSPYELLVLAVLVDAEFGNLESGGMWYTYTLFISLILLGTVYIKPYLRFYQ